jgi:anti-sigma B factor antagonist
MGIPAAAFHVDDTPVGRDIHVILASGEVDANAAPELRQKLEELLADGKRRIVFDLSGATFIDSTAIGVLALSVRRLRPRGGALAVVCSHPRILETFEVIGLERVVPVHPTRSAALVELAGVPQPPR